MDNGRKSISSFGLENNEHGHPAAGLCKRCWRTFSDPEAFDNHFHTNCEIVSRSKREKYGILRDTFCQLDPTLARTEDAASYDSDVYDLPDAEGDAEGDADGDAEDTIPANTTGARSHLRGDDVVSRSEHNSLMERVAALERMFQPRIPQATPRIMPNQQEAMSHALMSSSAATGTRPAHPVGHYTFDVGPQGHTVEGRGGSGEPRGPVAGMYRRPVNYRDQIGFNMDTESVMTDYRPSVASRSDSMSTVHRTSPVTTTHHYGTLGGQAKPASASDSAYGTASNAGMGNAPPTQSGGAANITAQPGIQMSAGGGGGDDDYGQEGNSQASSTTRLINQFMQAEEQREAAMGRPSFYNTDTDDIVSNFLNMDSQ